MPSRGKPHWLLQIARLSVMAAAADRNASAPWRRQQASNNATDTEMHVIMVYYACFLGCRAADICLLRWVLLARQNSLGNNEQVNDV